MGLCFFRWDFVPLCKLCFLFWVIWPCLATHAKTDRINLKKPLNLLMFICRQNINSSFMFFCRCCKDIANLLFWVLWACLATHTQSDTINLQKTQSTQNKKFVYLCHIFVNMRGIKLIFCLQLNTKVYLQAKNQLHPPCVSDDIGKICELIFGTLGMSGYAHPKYDCINLQETSMFICMPKMNLIIDFLLEILHFKESCNLIVQHYFGL